MAILCILLSLWTAGESTRKGSTCLAADGNVAAVGGNGGVDLIADGKVIPLGEPRNVLALCFRGEKLLEAGGRPGEGGEARCWDWKSRKALWQVEDHEDVACSIAVAGSRVFTGSADKSIAVRELETGKRVQYLTGHAGAVLALAASPDGKLLASSGSDGSIRLWRADELVLLRAIHNHGDAVNALAWSPDGKLLASASSDRTVRVWQPEINRLVRIVRGHDSKVLSLAFGEKTIVSGAADGKVRVIDAGNDAILKVIPGHEDWVCGVAITPQGILSTDWTGKTRVSAPF